MVDLDQALDDMLGYGSTASEKSAPEKVVVGSSSSSTPKSDGFVSFGTKVSGVPIPRFKAMKESKSRIAILSDKILPLKTHYVEGLGSIVCLEGKCCEIEGLPRVRYLLPIVEYDTNKSGAIIDHNLSVRVLSLGSEQYAALVDAVEFSGKGVKDVDIIVSCSDEQYQKLTFAVDASKGASWKTFETAKQTVEFFKANRDKMSMAVARTVSEDVYLTSKGYMKPQASVAMPSSMATVSSVEDLLDD